MSAPFQAAHGKSFETHWMAWLAFLRAFKVLAMELNAPWSAL
jgi:hypothetical protein